MPMIHINKVKKTGGYTINLRGTLEHSNFDADLAGTSLNIKSPHKLNKVQQKKLLKELENLFPQVEAGIISESDIDVVLKDNDGIISIKV